MPDTIGDITVPEIAIAGMFPIVPDYPYGRASRPDVAMHQFGSATMRLYKTSPKNPPMLQRHDGWGKSDPVQTTAIPHPALIGSGERQTQTGHGQRQGRRQRNG